VKTDQEFKNLIPPLAPDEYAQLEENILAEGCREPLVLWKEQEILLDGHNRLEICNKHGLSYKTTYIELPNREAAKVWIIDNQKGRRNLTDLWKFELAQTKKEILLELGKKTMKESGKIGREIQLGGLSFSDKPPEPHNTRDEIAKDLDWSTGKTAQADFVRTHAPEVWKQSLHLPEAPSINKLYADVKREQRRTEIVAKLEDESTKEAKAIEGLYDVIVIDPPWEMEKIKRDERPNQVAFDYTTMSEEELKALNIPASQDCHLWLWTTHKHLPTAFRVLQGWGFRYVCTFVWHKPGGFQPIGLPQYNCEFALYARKGSPHFIELTSLYACFNAPRTRHSEKPSEFYETVRRITAGRRIDMFSRRGIKGFDAWGKES